MSRDGVEGNLKLWWCGAKLLTKHEATVPAVVVRSGLCGGPSLKPEHSIILPIL